jgi:hypothetical protein
VVILPFFRRGLRAGLAFLLEVQPQSLGMFVIYGIITAIRLLGLSGSRVIRMPSVYI